MAVDYVPCSGCGALIWWALTIGGKRMPIDQKSHPDGNVVPVLIDGKRRVKVLAGAEMPAQTKAWRAHFTTCPASDEYRKRTARTAPRCTVCRGAMDADLARREQWTTHPSCEPPRAARPKTPAAVWAGEGSTAAGPDLLGGDA